MEASPVTDPSFVIAWKTSFGNESGICSEGKDKQVSLELQKFCKHCCND